MPVSSSQLPFNFSHPWWLQSRDWWIYYPFHFSTFIPSISASSRWFLLKGQFLPLRVLFLWVFFPCTIFALFNCLWSFPSAIFHIWGVVSEAFPWFWVFHFYLRQIFTTAEESACHFAPSTDVRIRVGFPSSWANWLGIWTNCHGWGGNHNKLRAMINHFRQQLRESYQTLPSWLSMLELVCFIFFDHRFAMRFPCNFLVG